MRYFFTTILALLYSTTALKAQLLFEKISSPVVFENTLSVYNPAAISLSENFNAQIGTQRRAGNWKSFNYNFASLSFQFNKQNNRNHHKNYLGVLLEGENNGPFISYQQFMLNYTWRTKISYEYFMAASIEMGGSSMYIEGTDITGNGSDMTFNGNAGLVFSNNKLVFGFAGKQITGSSLQPLDVAIKFQPAYHAHASYSYAVSKALKLRPAILYSWESVDNSAVNLYFEAAFEQNFKVGSGYATRSGLYFMVSVYDISIDKHKFDFYTAYILPIQNSSTHINQFEFTLKYRLP